ncbi:MAG: hypothetical protein AB7F99_06005 [Vicinamibacterales bacterium]
MESARLTARSKRDWIQRALLSVVAVTVLSANLVVIVNPYLRRSDSAIPIPAAVGDLFLLFGVFSHYETTNQEMTIWGLARNPATGSTYWKHIPTAEYFPHLRGEQNGRLWANRQYAGNDREAHWSAWTLLGRKILDRHNRLNPHEQISEVALQSVSWPRSVDGFYAARNASSESRRYWTVAKAE